MSKVKLGNSIKFSKDKYGEMVLETENSWGFLVGLENQENYNEVVQGSILNYSNRTSYDLDFDHMLYCKMKNEYNSFMEKLAPILRKYFLAMGLDEQMHISCAWQLLKTLSRTYYAETFQKEVGGHFDD